MTPERAGLTAVPDLTGRRMVCAYTKLGRYGQTGDHDSQPSSLDAAFFEYKPDGPFDEFYCGCWGWE